MKVTLQIYHIVIASVLDRIMRFMASKLVPKPFQATKALPYRIETYISRSKLHFSPSLICNLTKHQNHRCHNDCFLLLAATQADVQLYMLS